MSEQRGTSPRGIQILREAGALLSGMRFTATLGDAARGEWASVFVAPRRDAGDTLTVHISCRPAWPQTVDWDKLALWVRPAAPTEGEAAAATPDLSWGLLPPLDERGYVAFSGLPAGGYSIGVGERAARGLLAEPPRGRTVARGGEGRRAVRTRGAIRSPRERAPADPGQAEREQLTARVARRLDRAGRSEADFPLSGLRVYPSRHLPLTATVLPGKETMEVAFETDHAELAGRSVRFYFLAADGGETVATGTVAFGPVPNEPDLWEAVWHGPRVAERADFLYELL